MTLEAKSDLKIELRDLNYLCSYASLASKGFLEMIETTGQLSFVDERCTLVKNQKQLNSTLLGSAKNACQVL